MNNPKDIVIEGYNKLSVYYRQHFNELHNTNYKKWLQDFLILIPQKSYVLELGCGDGIPIAEFISQNHDYLGIDISQEQIKMAKQNIPNAKFILGDMTSVTYSDNSFDGIIAFYSIIHIPVNEQYEFINKIYKWLKTNGILICTVGKNKWTGTESNWILKDVTMYWSHTDTETYYAWFKKIGFDIIKVEFITDNEGQHTLFLLQKTTANIGICENRADTEQHQKFRK